VLAAVRAAATRARQGDGPYLIEAMTYRMGPHTTSDDPTRYRSETDLERWNVKDPIPRYREWLQGQGLIDEASLAAITREVETAVEATRNRLKSAPVPAAGAAIFGRVYQHPPDSFLEERQEFESSLESN